MAREFGVEYHIPTDNRGLEMVEDNRSDWETKFCQLFNLKSYKGRFFVNPLDYGTFQPQVGDEIEYLGVPVGSVIEFEGRLIVEGAGRWGDKSELIPSPDIYKRGGTVFFMPDGGWYLY